MLAEMTLQKLFSSASSTQSLSEEVYGSMMLGIPSAHFDRAVAFIKNIANVQVEEVDHDVQ